MYRKPYLDTALVRGKASIEFALITAFVLTIIIIIASGYISYNEYFGHFRHDLELQLGAIADFKASEISQYLKERIGQGNMLFRRDSFYDSVKRFLEDQNDKKNTEFLIKWLNMYSDHYQYVGLDIIDAQGVARISVPDNKVKLLSPDIAKRLPEILSADHVQIGDFFRNPYDGRIYLSVLVPILNEDRTSPPIGVLVMRIDPEKYLYPFIKKWPTPSETAETLLVRRDGNDVLFLNELKFRKNTALNLRFSINKNNDLPAAMAALGKMGFVEGSDYRGVPVEAYVRGVPNSSWYIVARVDRDEAYAPLRRHVANLIGLIISLAISAAAIVWFILRRKDLLFYKEKYLNAKALLESEERYRRLFESARDGILLVDVYTGKILDVNPFMMELLKYSKIEFLGRYLWDIGAFKDVVPAKENFEKLQNMGYVRYEDLPLETKHGEKIGVEFVSNVYSVGDKKIIQCNVRDISERLRADVELKKSAHDWQVTFDSSGDLIMQLDREMNVIKANKAVIDILGLPMNEIIGKKCHKLVHGTDLPFSKCPVTKSAKTKQHESSELFFPNLNIWAIVSSDPIIEKNGEVNGFVHTVHDITERKRLEEKLEQAKDAQFKTLIENLPGKVYLKDKDSKFIACNKNYANDMNVSPEDIIGKTDYDIFPTYLAEKYREDDKRVMNSGQTENIEEEYIKIGEYLKEENRMIINTVKVPVKDASGNVFGVFGLFWDITEKKVAEEEVKILNKQMEFVLGATKTGLDIIDSDFNIVYIDKEWQEVYGDPTGKKCYEYFMDRSEDCPDCGVRKALETHKTVVTEEVLVKEGNRQVQVTSIPFQDKDGKWLVAEINFDITERKKAEYDREALLIRQQKINEFQKSLLIPASLDDKLKIITDSVVRIFDADFCRIWLIRPGDLCDKGCIHAEIKEGPHTCRFRDRCLHLVASSGRYTHIDGKGHARVPFGCYKIGLIASGEERKFMTNDVLNEPRVHDHDWARELGLVSFAGYQIKIPGEESIGVLALFSKRPITQSEDFLLDGIGVSAAFIVQEAVASEEMIRARAIKGSSEIKSKFVSMVSHELRSPMAAIKEGVNLVFEGLVGDINEEQKDLLDTVKRNADRLGRLINNVLDLQKIGFGRMDLDMQENDINETVREVCKSMSVLASEKGLDLTFDMDDSIPKSRFDRDRIIQVVTNLISNAIKFTEKGGITVTTENRAPVVRVVVKDTGPGIASSDLVRIFEPFEQISHLKGKKKIGTGLGLAISREIVVAHGGKIGLESEEGKGSSFNFILPIKERRK